MNNTIKDYANHQNKGLEITVALHSINMPRLPIIGIIYSKICETLLKKRFPEYKDYKFIFK